MHNLLHPTVLSKFSYQKTSIFWILPWGLALCFGLGLGLSFGYLLFIGIMHFVGLSKNQNREHLTPSFVLVFLCINLHQSMTLFALANNLAVDEESMQVVSYQLTLGILMISGLFQVLVELLGIGNWVSSFPRPVLIGLSASVIVHTFLLFVFPVWLTDKELGSFSTLPILWQGVLAISLILMMSMTIRKLIQDGSYQKIKNWALFGFVSSSVLVAILFIFKSPFYLAYPFKPIAFSHKAISLFTFPIFDGILSFEGVEYCFLFILFGAITRFKMGNTPLKNQKLDLNRGSKSSWDILKKMNLRTIFTRTTHPFFRKIIKEKSAYLLGKEIGFPYFSLLLLITIDLYFRGLVTSISYIFCFELILRIYTYIKSFVIR